MRNVLIEKYVISGILTEQFLRNRGFRKLTIGGDSVKYFKCFKNYDLIVDSFYFYKEFFEVSIKIGNKTNHIIFHSKQELINLEIEDYSFFLYKKREEEVEESVKDIMDMLFKNRILY